MISRQRSIVGRGKSVIARFALLKDVRLTVCLIDEWVLVHSLVQTSSLEMLRGRLCLPLEKVSRQWVQWGTVIRGLHLANFFTESENLDEKELDEAMKILEALKFQRNYYNLLMRSHLCLK